MQQPPVWRLVYKILSSPPFSIVIKWLDENAFFVNDPVVEKHFKLTQPQLLIFPGSAMDAYSHIVARTATKCKIPSVMLISHWDFFSKKSAMRFSPTKIYVWGEDMKKMALLDKATNKNSIEVVGSPNLDKYRYLVTQDHSIFRSMLGIPLSAKILLFAGTSVPYDEVYVLQRINLYLERNNIHDTYIIYRPHPRGWVRKSKATAEPSIMKFVKIDQPESKNPTTQDHYIKLLSAVDGIVSPFSTMILEGALCGKNVLCISFADSINEFDFSITNTTDHLQKIKNKSWSTVCDRSENFEEDLANFMKKIDKRKLTELDIKDIIYYDEMPYSERLHLRIKKDFFL
jgi:hypothetical protein